VNRTSWMVAGALLVTLVGCGRLTGRTGEVPVDDRPVRLHVVNYYALPVEVYAIAGGTSYRMGTVNPGMRRTFLLRQNMIGQGTVQFEAHPADRRQPAYSGDILLAPGDEVDFEITAQLVNSIATVRP